MTRRKMLQIILGLALVAVFGIRALYVKHPILTGETMGTGYSVTLKGYVARNALNELHQQIESELAGINRQMSTWDPKSEISVFNLSDESGPFPTSPAFAAVVARALELGESTGGTFDPTLQPLLNLWGFGSEGEEREIPSDADIAAAMVKTGSDKVWFDKSSSLWKAAPGVQLDLGAIAKGYGVDAVGQLLDGAGHENWFAEIGGEVVVRGLNPKGNPWRIGIQYPSSNPAVDQLQGIVNLTGGAVATSGDYRNYIEQDGIFHSHILDPRSLRGTDAGRSPPHHLERPHRGVHATGHDLERTGEECQAAVDLDHLGLELEDAIVLEEPATGSVDAEHGPGHLQHAARTLADHEVVILPALDGGYALIGCTRADPELFRNISWSSDQVLQQTLATPSD